MNGLKIEKKPFSETLYFSATFSSEELWEDEYETQNYDLTIVVTHNNDDQTYSIDEIIWTDDYPRNMDQVEDYINENFFEITGLS